MNGWTAICGMMAGQPQSEWTAFLGRWLDSHYFAWGRLHCVHLQIWVLALAVIVADSMGKKGGPTRQPTPTIDMDILKEQVRKLGAASAFQLRVYLTMSKTQAINATGLLAQERVSS